MPIFPEFLVNDDLFLLIPLLDPATVVAVHMANEMKANPGIVILFIMCFLFSASHFMLDRGRDAFVSKVGTEL